MAFSRKVYVDHLTRVPLFSACTKKQLSELARHVEQVSVPAGTEVVTEGSAGQEFFVIADGEAEVRRDGATIATLGPGDHFGELALLLDAPRSATVAARSELDLLILARSDFLGELEDAPTMTVKLLRGLAARLLEVEASI